MAHANVPSSGDETNRQRAMVALTGRGRKTATPRRRIRQAVLTALLLIFAVVGLYFLYYAAIFVPHMHRLARKISLTVDPPPDRPGIPAPTGTGDAGPLYARALELAKGQERMDLERLAAVTTKRERPENPLIRVDLEALKVLRQAAQSRGATLPGPPFACLERRAGFGTPASSEGSPELLRLGQALAGAAEVHLTHRRDSEAVAYFRAAYSLGCHLSTGAGDIDGRIDGYVICRMAALGLQGIAESRRDSEMVSRLWRHRRDLERTSSRAEEQRDLLSGDEADHLEAAVIVATKHADPVWRREATVGLVQLSRLRWNANGWAWLTRRRARDVLLSLRDDPDPGVRALATKATE